MGLMNLFMRKQLRIQDLMCQYMDQWSACATSFGAAWETYLEHGCGEAFDFKVEQTHKAESLADDMRRQIEFELYSKALLPESRGDILGTLESVDRLLTDAEWVLYELKLQEMVIPEELRPPFGELVNVVVSVCEVVDQAIRVLFVQAGGVDDVRPFTEKIDTIESQSDHLERSLIRTIFKTKMGAGRKVLLKGLVMLLGRVSDRAEHVSNRITLVSVKRRV